MDLFNLSDGIFRESGHTLDIVSRCAHHLARPYRTAHGHWPDAEPDLDITPAKSASRKLVQNHCVSGSMFSMSQVSSRMADSGCQKPAAAFRHIHQSCDSNGKGRAHVWDI